MASSAFVNPTKLRAYEDHASDPICGMDLFHFVWRGSDAVRQSVESGDTCNFPVLLYVLLNETSKDVAERRIIAWNQNGRGFHVQHRTAFESQIMPRFFQSRKYTTFQRQLKRYQFSRVICGLDRGSFFHPFFLRGRPDLLLGHVERLAQRDPCPAEFQSDTLDNFPPCRELSREQFLALCAPEFAGNAVANGSESKSESTGTSQNGEKGATELFEALQARQQNNGILVPQATSMSQHSATLPLLVTLPCSSPEAFTATTAREFQSTQDLPCNDEVNDLRVFPFDSCVAATGRLLTARSNGKVFFQVPKAD